VFGNKDDSSANDLTQGTYGEMEDGAAEFIEAPNAQLIFYSDSGHGCPVQYRELVAEHIRIFLDRSLDDGQVIVSLLNRFLIADSEAGPAPFGPT
jgi:hypothetical protein